MNFIEITKYSLISFRGGDILNEKKEERPIRTNVSSMPDISVKGLEALSKVIADFLLEMSDAFYKSKDLFKDIQYDSSRLSQTIKEIADHINDFGSVIEKFKTISAELGYSPNFDIEPEQISEIVSNYTLFDKKTANIKTDEYFIKKYDLNAIVHLNEKWTKSTILKSRIHILNEAITAHNNAYYYLSIPPLLTQIEGLIAEIFDHKGQMRGSNLLEYLDKLLVKKDNTFSFDNVINNIYKISIMTSFTHGSPIKSILSRHAIMHGGDIKYGTITNSLKCILLFDYIHDRIKDYIKLSKKKECLY